MSERRSFYRKIGYAVAIGLLLFPLAWLSSPATTREAGGQLARLRNEYRLGQGNLGEIDPASETMKLATLGLRGVAVNLLWEKANYYKKVEDWDNLSATLNQLANLQPNFIIFWKFQAWNLSYNVSVEFDDFRDRYAKVIEGIRFLMRGERYNVGNANLLWDLGWFIGNKIGRADEHVQYRRLFNADDDFRAIQTKELGDLAPDQWDNWLVGKEWFLRGIDSIHLDPTRIGRKSPRIYFSQPAMNQINYAEAIEEEGYFDKARRAWTKAAEEWRAFGALPIEHSTGVKLRLGEKAKLEKEVADLEAQLNSILPGVREKLAEEKRSALTPEERALLDMPEEKLTAEQYSQWHELQAKLEVSDREVADRIAREKPEEAKRALKLANDLARQNTQLQYTNAYRRDSNYDFWENTCNFEQTENALDARKAMFNGRKAFQAADLPTAKRLYQEGFAKWRLVIDEFPLIKDNENTTGDDLIEYIKHYREVLEQLDETLGEDFPLWDIIENFDRERDFAEELANHKKLHSENPTESGEQASPPATATEAAGQQPPDTTTQGAAQQAPSPAGGTSSQPAAEPQTVAPQQ